MRPLILTITAFACLVAASTSAADSSLVKNVSYTTEVGERVLEHEVVIPAGLDSAWWAWTTTEGMTSWVVPIASIDLKTDGLWETNYDPSAKLGDSINIRNTVLCYVPKKMLALKIGLTRQFPAGPREAGTLFVVLTFAAVDEGHTKLTGSMLGWGTGPDWNEVYKQFEWGNGYTFEKLYERFAKGPTVWPVVQPR